MKQIKKILLLHFLSHFFFVSLFTSWSKSLICLATNDTFPNPEEGGPSLEWGAHVELSLFGE